MNFNAYKPWIICIESYEPGSNVETYKEWEDIIIENGYEYTYSRGVNRYYCSKEKKDICERLKCMTTMENDFEIVKMGNYEGLINSKFYRYTTPIRKMMGFLSKLKSRIC